MSLGRWMNRYCVWLLCVAFSGFLLFQNPSLNADDIFTEDISKAVETAKKEQKDLFLLFTGSDWCPPCKKLESEVFAQAEFAERTAEGFVLVKFDFPKELKQTEELKKQNAEWAERFAISGYPTVAVVDSELRPIGFLGYMEGGPDPFLLALDNLRELRMRRDFAFAKLPDAKDDDERAALLDQGLAELDPKIIEVYYAKELDEIDRIDADNHLGLRSKYFGERDAEARKAILTDINIVSRLDSVANAIAFIDEVLAAVPFTIDERFEIFQIKLGLLQKDAQIDQANKLIDEMLAIEGLVEETRERLLVRKLMQTASANQIDAALAIVDETLKLPGEHLLVRLAQGQLLAKKGSNDQSLEVYANAIARARFAPDILIELVGSQADLLYRLDRAEEALRALDNFTDDTQMPTDLRCESLLQQAMLMRDMGRTRPAMLTENRAVELADSPALKREIQAVVEQIRNSNATANDK